MPPLSNHTRKLDPARDLGPDSSSIKGPFSLPEVRIAVYYVLGASLWIIGSDALLCWLGVGSHSLFLQSFKGLNFVVTTGILLYLLLRRAYAGWRRSEELRVAAIQSARECYRKLSSKNQVSYEEERTRISREIHDELGQLLTGTKMQLRLIEDHLANREDRSLNPLIDEVVEASATIDETINSVRRIAAGLRPLALDDLGLATALEEEAELFSRRTKIDCHLNVGKMEEFIPPEFEITTFRIFQESLTNVARHAQAHRIEAGCSIVGGVLVLTVRDDGVGIDPAAIRNPESLGLVGMFERAADAGGNLVFKSVAGHGTEVTLTIPIAPESSP
jgi:signal transduction histidine kinase